MKNFTFEYTSRDKVKIFIEENHYSKNINGIKSTFCFSLSDQEGELVGACIFGQMSTTAWKKFSNKESDVLELRRLCLIDSAPRNTESWFVSRCIKYIKKNSSVNVIVSYADPYYNHIGYIYQASNFLFVGETPKDKVLLDKDTMKTYHSRALRTKYNGKLKPFAQRLQDKQASGELEEIIVPGKYCYVFPLSKEKKEEFMKLSKPYPKKGCVSNE